MTGTLTGVEYHILHGDGDFAFRSDLCRNLEVRTTYTAALDLDLGSNVLQGLLPDFYTFMEYNSRMLECLCKAGKGQSGTSTLPLELPTSEQIWRSPLGEANQIGRAHV